MECRNFRPSRSGRLAWSSGWRLPLRACASKNSLTGSDLSITGRGGGARQHPGIRRQRRRPGLLRHRFRRILAAGDRHAQPPGPVAPAISALHLRHRGPRRRARHARVQHRARCPPRHGGSATISWRGASPPTACASSPTARNGRSRSATISPAGRRTGARSSFSTPPASDGPSSSHRDGGSGRRFRLQRPNLAELARPMLGTSRRCAPAFRHGGAEGMQFP